MHLMVQRPATAVRVVVAELPAQELLAKVIMAVAEQEQVPHMLQVVAEVQLQQVVIFQVKLQVMVVPV